MVLNLSMEGLLGSIAIQISFLSLLFASLFLLVIVVNERQKKAKVPNLPPGPRKIPIIGNMNQLLGQLPHRRLKDLALKHGDLLHLQLGQISTIVVSSTRIAQEIMKTHDVTFSSRPKNIASKIVTYGCNGLVFSPYGAYWRQVRKICILELLSDKRVQSFRLVREDEVSLLLQSIMSTSWQPVNLTRMLFSLTNGITSRVTFGRRSGHLSGLESTMRELFEFTGGFNMGDFFPSFKFVTVISGMKFKLERIHHKFDRILSEIIEERKAKSNINGGSKQEYLVDVFLRLQKSNTLEVPLTENNIKGVLLDVFLAGVDTASTTMEWSMAELMRNPNVMEKAQREVRDVVGGKGKVEESDTKELKYLRSILKETLRLHPPTPLSVPRESTERCTIDGYEIPAKTGVIFNSWAIGRDPQQWENAETFNPERFFDSRIDFKGQSFEMIPFGGGRRGCPGIGFGLMIMELTLASLLYHFNWKLPNEMRPEEMDMSERFGMVAPRKSNLTIIPIPHIPLPK